MTTPAWWQDAICYQVYPRSFADANGDGIGDIPGLISKLDYLQWLGVTALWISPFYPSPNLDWGYDVSDYRAVDRDYGTMADVDRLIAEAHSRGMRIILDLVLNHTSDQHEWFRQSRLSRDNPYRDFYVWRDGKDGGPPNDWESLFGGSAWGFDEASGQYFYHFFFPGQPDLNWRNPAVKEAMFDVVRFWLDRGVDGFRLDAIPHIYEREDLPDCEVDFSLTRMFLEARQGVFDGQAGRIGHKIRYQENLPETHDLMRELRALVDTYPDRILLGETMDTAYYGDGSDELHSVFNFEIIHPQLDVAHLWQSLAHRLPLVPDGAWDSNTVGNHDRPRSLTHFADGRHDRERAELALALIMFLRGTPVLYYGEEIGMSNLPPSSADQFQDALATWAYRAMLSLPDVEETSAFRIAADHVCRDICRTPMQWRNVPNAGFSPQNVITWLPVNPEYTLGVNVEDQREDPRSLLNSFRMMGSLRRDHIALRRGDIELEPVDGGVLAFWRRYEGERYLVCLNFSAAAAALPPAAHGLETLFRKHQADDASHPGDLEPYEYAIFRTV